MFYTENNLSTPKAQSNTLFADEALVFHGKGRDTIITYHPIEDNKLGFGKLANRDEVARLLRKHTRHQPKKTQQSVDLKQCIIPRNVLVDNDNYLIWQRPSTKQDIWFLKEGQHHFIVHWPNLLFSVNKTKRTLRVFGTATGSRATLSTRLYRAPLMNCSGNGQFCLGQAELPHDLSITTIAAIEACVIEPNFTHLNDENTSISHYGDNMAHIRFWRNKSANNSKVTAKDMLFYMPFANLLDELKGK